MTRELHKDRDFAIPIDQPSDRRDQTDAGRLRRAAHAARFAGYTSLAILYENSAWVAENGCNWLEYVHHEGNAMLDGRTDDITVREVKS